MLTCIQGIGMPGSMTRPRSRPCLFTTFRFRCVSSYLDCFVILTLYLSREAYTSLSVNATAAGHRCRLPVSGLLVLAGQVYPGWTALGFSA